MAEIAKQAMNYMSSWEPSWKLSKNEMLMKGVETAQSAVSDAANTMASKLPRSIGQTLATGFFSHYIYDQSPSTQLVRCLFLTLAVQLGLGFVPHQFAGFEKHTNFLGAANFILLTAFTFFLQPDWGLRKCILSAMVCLWATRLIAHFALRSKTASASAAADKRVAYLRGRPAAKLAFWLGQAAWVFVTMLPIILMNSEDSPRVSYKVPGVTLPKTLHTPVGNVHLPDFFGKVRGPSYTRQWATDNVHNLNGWDWAGMALFVVGLAIETIADAQKMYFHRTQKKSGGGQQQQQGSGQQQASQGQQQQQQQQQQPVTGKFINWGLWRYSRHPNYLGEILVWVGLWLSASNALPGWRGIAVLSPLFVTFLLTAVTGIPRSEDEKQRSMGNLPLYQQYKKTTAMLMPGIL